MDSSKLGKKSFRGRSLLLGNEFLEHRPLITCGHQHYNEHTRERVDHARD